LRHRAPTFGLAATFVCASLLPSPSRANDAPSLPDAPELSAAATARCGPGSTRADGKARPAEVVLPPAVRRQDAAEHHFWDRQNVALFASVGASRALDYSSTLNMRRRGLQEILLTNGMVDNHPEFAAIEAGATALSIGASYLFHRYHHHQLERWTSVVHASLATSGAIRNYALKPARPSTAP
jgi:hypothetical protein